MPTGPLPAMIQWTPRGRSLTFLLASTSIWCLLAEMYGLMQMRPFFYFILLPATTALYTIALLDRSRGDHQLWKAVMLGTIAGLIGAVAYDVFRLPFVFSRAWNLQTVRIPQMPLFKVFPRFGALILGQPVEQPSYTLPTHLLGWAYHFSNGASFGVMFAAMLPTARIPKRGNVLLGAITMAVGIELCLLISPYSRFFAIEPTARFIAVTMIAHLIFGLFMGLVFIARGRPWLAMARA